jgi:hypothetical protein
LQVPWVNGFSDELLVEDIETARRLMTALQRKLDAMTNVKNEPDR